MIEVGVIGTILIAVWLMNSDVTKKTDAKTLFCIGVCLETKADLIEGNEHDENDPSVLKILNDNLTETK